MSKLLSECHFVYISDKIWYQRVSGQTILFYAKKKKKKKTQTKTKTPHWESDFSQNSDCLLITLK